MTLLDLLSAMLCYFFSFVTRSRVLGFGCPSSHFRALFMLNNLTFIHSLLYCCFFFLKLSPGLDNLFGKQAATPYYTHLTNKLTLLLSTTNNGTPCY